jgi:hypothetical protein
MATEEYSIGYEQGKQDGFNEAMAQQRTWVGLTDEEIRACIASNKYAFEIVRAAEAKLKEKNT